MTSAAAQPQMRLPSNKEILRLPAGKNRDGDFDEMG